MMPENLERIRRKINATSLDDFEGFSPNEMAGLLYSPFDPERSPMKLNREIDDRVIARIPLILNVFTYLGMLKERSPLRLTQKGNLPRQFVRDLLGAGNIAQGLDYLQAEQIMKETDLPPVHFLNLFTRLLGFTRKEHGKLYLTKKAGGHVDAGPTADLYHLMLKTYTTRFNWAYNDFFPQSHIIQMGFGFSIFLVWKYGAAPKMLDFYSERFLQAFPGVVRDFPDTMHFPWVKRFRECYRMRVIERFLETFGLIEVERIKDGWGEKIASITKTDLVDQLVTWKRPQGEESSHGIRAHKMVP